MNLTGSADVVLFRQWFYEFDWQCRCCYIQTMVLWIWLAVQMLFYSDNGFMNSTDSADDFLFRKWFYEFVWQCRCCFIQTMVLWIWLAVQMFVLFRQWFYEFDWQCRCCFIQTMVLWIWLAVQMITQQMRLEDNMQVTWSINHGFCWVVNQMFVCHRKVVALNSCEIQGQVPTYYLANYSSKLPEKMKEIYMERGYALLMPAPWICQWLNR